MIKLASFPKLARSGRKASPTYKTSLPVSPPLYRGETGKLWKGRYLLLICKLASPAKFSTLSGTLRQTYEVAP